ncbi:hypothetical protein [Streptomyces sp. NPDC101206]|uniref:hypothetical protein n=1 Tax=Streptomyces sp. NPDC101206 TaxID=3366128 RepID=UPI00382384E2
MGTNKAKPSNDAKSGGLIGNEQDVLDAAARGDALGDGNTAQSSSHSLNSGNTAKKSDDDSEVVIVKRDDIGLEPLA